MAEANSAIPLGTRRALTLHGAATASPLTVLLLRRHDVAAHLELIGAIVGEATMIGIVAVVAAWVSVRWRDRVPAGATLFLGSVMAAVGLYLMAWTIEVGYFLAGGILFAVGAGPALVIPRVLLSSAEDPALRLRTTSWYWAAVAAGAGWPLGVEILWDPSYRSILWISFALMITAAVLLAGRALDHDEDVETEPTARRTDVPWARRSVAAAFGGGAIVLGGADPAQALLVGEWQRSPEQTAAVLAAGLAAGLLILAVGPWYHRLDRLAGSRRADVIGIQLGAAGLLTFIGGLSFTYIGLIVSWAIAGGLLALAAAGLDAAVFPSVAPDLRRLVAARQVRAAAVGGAIAIIWNSQVIGGWSDQWKIALTGLPLLAVGFAVRRFADPATDATIEATSVSAATVPRRVSGLDGERTALLSIEQLDVAYGSVQVLFGVDMRVDEGEVVALMGTNGAGKTTLLRAISGLEPTIGGRLVYAGLDITRTRPTWRVGMGVHQVVGGAAVVPTLTVHENLRLFSHTAPAAQRQSGIEEAYDLFPRLRERHDQRAATLSGGEKQMLALAKPLIVPPRLLLVDEFSLGLAPAIVADLLPVVRSIADRGASVLLVEQSVNVALSIADRAYVMEKGTIGFSGDAADLRDRPDLLRAAYLQGITKALEDR